VTADLIYQSRDNETQAHSKEKEGGAIWVNGSDVHPVNSH